MMAITAYRKLFASLQEHRAVEERVRRLIEETLDSRYIKPAAKPPSMLKYAQRHFFSTLFLAIYRALGIPEERRLFYGVINHCLRGIVTGADNLLDDEYKEMLPLAFPDKATRFKSIMHILLFERFLHESIDELSQADGINRQAAADLHRAIFAAIVPIGAQEAGEEGGIEEILSPRDILDSVHMFKGGNLLCLAFVAPSLLERDKAGRIELARQGVFSIGLALQVIDDLTDFYQDIVQGNHNYLVSSVRFNGPADERNRLDAALADRAAGGPPIEKSYPKTVRVVMEEAIGEALKGFALLHQAGFWIDPDMGRTLIRHLFRLRGVKSLLPFFPKHVTRSLSGDRPLGEKVAL